MSQTTNTIFPAEEQSNNSTQTSDTIFPELEQSTNTLMPVASQTGNSLFPPSGSLVVLYQSGQHLKDSYGILPRDSYGRYVSRYDGSLILVDDGFEEGDTVGEILVYGTSALTVVGSPANLRRSGLNTIGDSNYLSGTQVSSGGSFLSAFTFSSTLNGDSLIFGVGTDPRWGNYIVSSGETRAYVLSGSIRVNAKTTIAYSIGTRYYVLASVDSNGQNASVYIWNSSGTLIGSATDTDPGVGDMSGQPYYIGRAKSAGNSFDRGTIEYLALWDGSTINQSMGQTIVDSLVAGNGVATETTADIPLTDGLICGAYDATNETILFSLTGAGDLPTVELSSDPQTDVLVAKKTIGGYELQESSVELSLDSEDHYIRTSTEELLIADSGLQTGDTISNYYPQGSSFGVVTGRPATLRGSGYDNLDLSNYLTINASSQTTSFIFKIEITGVMTNETAVFNVDANPDWRWGLIFPSANQLDGRLFQGSTLIKTATVSSAGAFNSGNTVYIAGHCIEDGAGNATMSIVATDNSGVEIGRDSISQSGVSGLDGLFNIGRGRGGGAFTDGTILKGWGWDGTGISVDDLIALIQDDVAGAALDALGADIYSDGLLAGWYDPSDTTWLAEIAGSGAALTVESLG